MRMNCMRWNWPRTVQYAVGVAHTIVAVIFFTSVVQAPSVVLDIPFDKMVITDELESAPEYQATLRNPDLGIAGSVEIVTDGRHGAGAFADLKKRVRLGDFAGLAADARSVLARNINSGLAYEIVGTAHFLAGRYDAAEAAFKTALEVESGQSGPLAKLGVVYLQMGDTEAAEATLQEAVKINPADRFANQRLGILYEQAGNTEKAIFHYTQGLQGTDANYLGVAVNLGALLNSRQGYAETLRILEQRVPLDSHRVDAQHILGVAYLGTGNYASAQTRFEQVLALNPDFRPALLGESMAARGLGKHNRAAKIVDRLIAKYPEWPAAHTERGQVLLGMDKLDQAASAFKHAQQLGADRALIGKLLTTVYVKHSAPAQAEAVLNDLIRTGDADPDIYGKLSELRLARGDAIAGERALKDGIRKFPSSAYLIFRLGSYLGALRRYPEAIALFNQALTLSPDDPTVLQALSLAKARRGDLAGSAATAQRLYNRSPRNRDIALLYATRLQADKQDEKAIEVYRAILDFAPDDALTLNNLAYLLAEHGHLKEAIRHATRAVQLADNNGRVLDTLGWVRYRQGRHAEALKTFNRAIKLTPDAASIHYHKGLALAGLGREDEATKAIGKALSMNPNASWAGDAKTRLSDR